MKHITFALSALLLFTTCKKEEKTTPPAPTSFSVQYSGNGNTGGTPPVDGNSYSTGASVVTKENEGNLVKTGYTFFGWNTSANGSGTDYAPGQTLVIGNSDLGLYAKWRDNALGPVYKVTYLANGNTAGSVPVDYNFYNPGATFTVKGNTGGLSKNGHAFVFWNTYVNGAGQPYVEGDKIPMQQNLNLYAIYDEGANDQGKYIGFDADGQVKSKSSLTSTWDSEDSFHTFGTNLVTVTWNGSKYIGFNAAGESKSKSRLNAAWISEDQHAFGSSLLVAVVWNGSKYIGFNAMGQVRSKSSLTDAWVTEDFTNYFGVPGLVAVVWDGSNYFGFDSAGEVRSKATPTSPWINEDLNDTFNPNLAAVIWDGAKFIGFSSYGQTRSKATINTAWTAVDLTDTFGPGSSNLVCTARQ